MILRFIFVPIVLTMWFGTLLVEGFSVHSVIKIVAFTWVAKIVLYDQHWRK